MVVNEPQPGETFRQLRAFMAEPPRPIDPLTDAEIEELMWQPPLPPEVLNDIMQLPANEFPSDDNNNQIELHLNYHEH